MIIKGVKLLNIRSYTDATISFSLGTTMLSGDIGCGKTTILLSIEFALFGITSEVDGNALLRTGTDFGEVELKFYVDGNELVIKRGLRRQKGTVRQMPGYLIVNGLKKELTPLELKANIIELLGYPKDHLTKSKSLIYRYTVYTPQEDMKLILLEDREARLQTLRQVFQIDKYSRIKDNCDILVRNLREKARLLAAKTEGLEEDTSRLKELEGQIIQTEQILLDMSANAKQVEEAIMEKKKELVLLEKNEKEHETFRKNVELTKLRLAERKKRVSESKEEITQTSLEISELEKRKTGSANIQRFSILISAAVNQIVKLKNDVCEKASLKSGITELEEKLSQAGAEIKKSLFLIDSSNKLVLGVSNLTTCPTCRQPVSLEHKEHIKEIEGEKTASAKTEIEQVSTEKKSIEEELSELRAKLELGLEKERQLLNLQAEMEIMMDTAESAGLLIASTDEKFTSETLSECRKLAKSIKESAGLTERITDKKKIIEVLSKRCELLLSEIIDHEKILEELEKHSQEDLALKRKLAETKDEIDRLFVLEKSLVAEKAAAQERIVSMNREKKRLTSEKERKLELRAEMDQSRKISHWLDEQFIGLVESIEKRMMGKIYNEFNTYFQTWFSLLIEDETMNIRLDEQFTPIIEQNGYELLFENLSGGERTSCALAYRLALNKAINSIGTAIKTKDILILDEPTDGFSTEQLERVRDVISQLATGQMIIVSHETKIESFVQNVIRISKENHSSRVVS